MSVLPLFFFQGATLVISVDGLNFSKDAIQIIIKMSAAKPANGVRHVWVGQNGLSTPAISAVIRERTGSDGSKATGAFILTANHNPGGPNEDFGIKCMANGPAPEGITVKIFENRRTFEEYLMADGLPHVDISAIGITKFAGPGGQFDVDAFDSPSDFVKLMKYAIFTGSNL